MKASSGSGECPRVKTRFASAMAEGTLSLRWPRANPPLPPLVVCHAWSAPVASFAMAKSPLGKGLGALISARPAPIAAPEPAPGERIHQIDLHSVSPSPLQPRKEFQAEALQELVSSIREHGIIQPL